MNNISSERITKKQSGRIYPKMLISLIIKRVMGVLLLVTVLSFSQTEKIRKIKHTTETRVDSIKVYNDVINDIVYNYIYDLFIWKGKRMLINDFNSKIIDSTTYYKTIGSYKSEIIKEYSDNAVFIYDLKESYGGFKRDIRTLRTKLPEEFNWCEVAHQVGKENILPIERLKSDFAKLTKPSDHSSVKYTLGDLYVSKFMLNGDKNRGVLYFSHYGYKNYGVGFLALIKKTNGQWKLEKRHKLWET